MMPIHHESGLKLASALSTNARSEAAGAHVARLLSESLGSDTPNLVLVFFSPHHAESAHELLAVLRRDLPNAAIVGASAGSVLADAVELEGSPAVAALALHATGARIHPFALDHADPIDDTQAAHEHLRERLGITRDLSGILFFPDPFSIPLIKLLPSLNAVSTLACPDHPAPILGGLCSGSKTPGGNVLFLNDRVMRAGAVGVSISGDLTIDTVVSQGCRPFGPPLVVTKARHNLILELGGRRAPEVLAEAIQSLGESARATLSDGLLVGLVINEYKERFGRDDFLMRPVVGLDQNSGGVAINDLVRVGQTVRLHYRDKTTAEEDLALLLDAQQLRDPPKGVFLVTCHTRGRRLFGRPHHDAQAVQRAFEPPQAGEDLAKGGRPVAGMARSIPLAGFSALGEIGPIAGQSFLHGSTACLALFRPKARIHEPNPGQSPQGLP
ncbi:MAG: FIST N-terminal domain-containing protein [Phycisphaerales bacterium]